MRVLTRMWQMLLKALEEVAAAPNAMMAAEMAVIRLTHVADLPDPEQLLRRLADGPGPSAPAADGARPGAIRRSRPPIAAPRASGHPPQPTGDGTATALARGPEVALARYASFPAVVELIRANRDVKLLLEVESHVRLVHYAPGRIEFEPDRRTRPATWPRRSRRGCKAWTGVRWGVSVVSGGGAAKTIAEERSAQAKMRPERKGKATIPLVKAVFAAFPKAHITAIRTPDQVQAEAEADALPEVEDEWDPFEEG